MNPMSMKNYYEYDHSDCCAPSVRPHWYRCRHQFKVQGTSRTVQSERDLTDINNIVNRYQRTGVIPDDPRGRTPMYEDVSLLNKPMSELIQYAKEVGGRVQDYLNLAKHQKAEADAREAEAAFQKRVDEEILKRQSKSE